MIKLERSNKPQVLVDNEQGWTESLLAAVSEYDGYRNIPQPEKDKLLVHYRHQDIKDLLFLSSHQKCAFCEAKPAESGNIEVEHFAPKSIYPDLAFDWINFLPSCRKCNGSKDDHDTVKYPIVNPYDNDPDEIFGYADVRISASSGRYKEIGDETIRACGLNSVRLMRPRADILIALHGFSDSIEEAVRDFLEADTDRKQLIRRRRILEALERIELLARPEERYSGFCKHYLSNCEPYQRAKNILDL